MNLSSNPRSMICLFTNNNFFLWDTSANVKIPTIKIKVLNTDFTFDFPRSSSSSISMFGSNEAQCSQHFLRKGGFDPPHAETTLPRLDTKAGTGPSGPGKNLPGEAGLLSDRAQGNDPRKRGTPGLQKKKKH